MDFATVIDVLTGWVVSIGQTVNDLPGTVAFGLGLFSWFAVEQVLKRMVNLLRWAIIIGVLGALGLSVPYLARLMLDRGGDVPELTIDAPES